MQAALRGGVRIVLGTDAGVIPHGSNAREFAALVQLGMTPIDAIRAGTISAALALKTERSDRFDRSRANWPTSSRSRAIPLADIGAMERVVLVVKEGQVVE